MAKYYAVRNGRTPGIYKDWEACKAQVDKFPGAAYKSFSNISDAEAFMNNDASYNNISKSDINTHADITYKYPLAFVDGSFNTKTSVYGYGGFLSTDPNNSYKLQGSNSDPDAAAMRNISGELAGAIAAINKALELNLTELYIYYDYAGIEKWATGEWKRNNRFTQAYHEFIQNIKSKINVKFIKVEAHVGIPGNELADKMAKQAVGILEETTNHE